MVALLVHPTLGGTNEEGAAKHLAVVFIVCVILVVIKFLGKVVFRGSRLACLPSLGGGLVNSSFFFLFILC